MSGNLIISIVGRIGAGKDTVANHLIDNYYFRKESFAKSLKDAVANVFVWPREMLEGNTEKSREWREQPDEFWSKELGYPVIPRQVLQQWGTEVVREGYHSNTWVVSLKKRLAYYDVTRDIKKYAITDARFPNEFKMLKDLNAYTILVERGLEKPVWWYNARDSAKQLKEGTSIEKTGMSWLYPEIHVSEWAWADETFDYVIDNNGTLEEFQDKIHETYHDICAKRVALA
jgi:hypothetical protein